MTDVLGPRPPRSHARLWVSTLLLLVYAGFVSLVTLWPTPDDLEFGGIASRVLKVLYRFGVPESFGFDELEFTANIGMFVPLGFFLGLSLHRKVWWLALFLLPGYSALIEFTQKTALAERVPSLLDVFANTAGGYVGLLFAMIIRAAIHARDERIVARAIWERDRQIIEARRHPLPSQPARSSAPVAPATRAYTAPTWNDQQTAPTERLPF